MFRGADQRAAERMLFPDHLAQQILRNLLGLVAVHHDLLDDHSALLLNVGGSKPRMEIHVRKHIGHGPNILRADARVIAGGLLLCEGVQISAAPFNLLRNRAGAAGLRALEKQMLQEMAHALHGLVFVPAADPHPDAHRHAGGVGHVAADNAQPVVEPGFLRVELHYDFILRPEASINSESVTVLS